MVTQSRQPGDLCISVPLFPLITQFTFYNSTQFFSEAFAEPQNFGNLPAVHLPTHPLLYPSHLSTHSFIHPPFQPSLYLLRIYPSIHSPTHSSTTLLTHPHTYPSAHPSLPLNIHPSTPLWSYLFIYPTIHLSIYPPFHLPLHLPIYLPTQPSIYVSGCLSIHPSVIHLLIHLSILSRIHLSVHLSMLPPTYPSTHPSVPSVIQIFIPPPTTHHQLQEDMTHTLL